MIINPLAIQNNLQLTHLLSFKFVDNEFDVEEFLLTAIIVHAR